MRNDKEITDIVSEFCLDEGYEFYPGYSGRGMYGRTCIGISHRDATATVMMRLAGYVLESFPDEPGKAASVMRRLEKARRDSLGLGTITYWPDIEAADASEQ